LKTKFWKTISDDFYDVCVLEWCKLFVDTKDPHHWRNVVSEPLDFERQLLGRLVIPWPVFEQYAKAIKQYRDRFVAHLDSDRIAAMPNLNIAEGATILYYSHVVSEEAKRMTAKTFPADLDQYSSECYYEALDVYEHCRAMPAS